MLSRIARAATLVMILIFALSCSADEAAENTDEQIIPDCGEAYPISINGDLYCVFQIDEQDEEPTCPEDMVISFVEERSWVTGPDEDFTVCGISEELPLVVEELFTWYLTASTQYDAQECSSRSFGDDVVCGSCHCEQCDDDICSFSKCTVANCEPLALCEETECVSFEDSDEPRCEVLPERWSTVVNAHKACDSVDDCTVVGRVEHCNCRPVLGDSRDASGTAINRDGASTATALIEIFTSDECEELHQEYQTCDAAPGNNLRCEDGTCQLDDKDCFF